MKGLNRLSGLFERLLYPITVCPICLQYQEGLCVACRDLLVSYAGAGVWASEAGISLYRHQEEVKTLISNFKTKGMFSAGETMGDLVFERFGGEISRFQFITYAPSSRKSLKLLGFDHGRYFAESIGKKARVKTVSLYLPPDTEQKVLDRDARPLNAKKISLRKEDFETYKGKDILLVDDVFTTGSTVCACLELAASLNIRMKYITFSKV